jgi:hypothetical protein
MLGKAWAGNYLGVWWDHFLALGHPGGLFGTGWLCNLLAGFDLIYPVIKLIS